MRYGKDDIKYGIIFNIRKYGTLSLAQLMEIILGQREFSGSTAAGVFNQTILDLLKVSQFVGL